MEKDNNLLTFFSASLTSKGSGVLLTFVRGEKPNREFYKVFVPYWGKGQKEPALHVGANPSGLVLRDAPRPYEAKASKKPIGEAGPQVMDATVWAEALKF